MGQFSKPWEDLTFTDNFIFCKVMSEERLCRRMIEILLGIEVEKIEYIATEKPLETYYESRGIRLDVYVKDSNRIFDLEMQTGDYDDLILRARYYQSASDVATVKRRTKFKSLKETYVLFLCKDDPFNAGIPVYTKKTVFAETESVEYNDKTHVVFYNASAWGKAGDTELRSLLRFISETKAESGYTRELATRSDAAKERPEWEDEYMYVEDIIEEEKEIAREEGLAEGMRKTALDNARNLLAMNILSTEQIAEAVGLTVDEVQSLRNGTQPS